MKKIGWLVLGGLLLAIPALAQIVVAPVGTGGAPTPPPVGCSNSLAFDDGCNSQYLPVLFR